MIKNVIFDLGSVLINNDPSEYIKSLGYSKEKSEALNEAISSDTIWHDKDIGIYESYVDCIPIFQRKHPEFAEEIAMFFQDGWMSKIYRPIEENMVLYERAKELGYSIYLLTNYSVDGFVHLESSFDFIREVQGRVVSSHVHLCKPDKRIYELLLAKYDLKASECIFFDDNPDNVTAAEELGIHAVLIDDIYEALRVLESVG